MNNRETKCRGLLLYWQTFKRPIFFTSAKEITQNRRYFATGTRAEYPMPVLYFLFKFKVYSESFGIAKRNVK